VTRQKYFSHPRLVFYFSQSQCPTHKTKTGLESSGRLLCLIPTHLDQTNYLAHQQQMVVRFLDQSNLPSQSIAAVRLCCPWPASISCGKILGENHFAEPKCMCWTFLYPIFFCWATYWALVKLFLEHYLRVPILISSFSTLCQQNVPSNFFQTSYGDTIDYFEYFEGP
jgi:hypothetical protein